MRGGRDTLRSLRSVGMTGGGGERAVGMTGAGWKKELLFERSSFFVIAVIIR